jgi:hypothetical protein
MRALLVPVAVVALSVVAGCGKGRVIPPFETDLPASALVDDLSATELAARCAATTTYHHMVLTPEEQRVRDCTFEAIGRASSISECNTMTMECQATRPVTMPPVCMSMRQPCAISVAEYEVCYEFVADRNAQLVPIVDDCTFTDAEAEAFDSIGRLRPPPECARAATDCAGYFP